MPLPGQTPEGSEGKYSPVQMAEWLIAEAASFKDPQDLLAEIGRQGFEVAPSEGGMAEDMPPLGEEPLGEEPLAEEGLGEEPPGEESPEKGPMPRGPAFLEMIRIDASKDAIAKDKKSKGNDEESKEEVA